MMSAHSFASHCPVPCCCCCCCSSPIGTLSCSGPIGNRDVLALREERKREREGGRREMRNSWQTKTNTCATERDGCQVSAAYDFAVYLNNFTLFVYGAARLHTFFLCVSLCIRHRSLTAPSLSLCLTFWLFVALVTTHSC